MPEIEPLKLSAEEIDAQKTPAGGWTMVTLARWGVPWPPPRGWRQALIAGAPIPRVQNLKITVTLRDGSQIELPEKDAPDAVWKIGASLIANQVKDWAALTVTLTDLVDEMPAEEAA